MTAILVALHIASISGLALYGLLGFLTLGLFLRVRDRTYVIPPLPEADLPSVTVQLPIYNEREVVQRLIAAVVALDYPRDKLEIQVLDDSIDETVSLAAACVRAYQARGYNIQLLHRNDRHGFKAGALQESLQQSRGELIAILDADFIPAPDFLRRVVPYFLDDPRIGAVQARWGHLNRGDSELTSAQAVALDKHFAVEQLVRHRATLFPKFNGSAGVWRRACIIDAGGWQIDTVCEDLCLSTRAVLAGWKFHFADDVVVPAELPATVLSYKVQQARWAMGATQCMVKYARQILHAEQQTFLARIYALLSMSAYLTHLLFLILLLVQLPLLIAGVRLPSWLFLFSIIGLGQPILFILAQHELYHDWLQRMRHFPTLLLVAIGLAPSNSWAVINGVLRRDFTFDRTPKGPRRSYRLTPGLMLGIEGFLFLYSVVTLIFALSRGYTGPVFLLATTSLGFGYVVLLGILELRPAPQSA
ncbi:MAG: glycosyltransferase [Candidatus Promineofilum sp.]|nr:glycosyltransferase [Promineifilum sp.]MBP9656749.1 glycosyltransferase [Promineifilum sp.]